MAQDLNRVTQARFLAFCAMAALVSGCAGDKPATQTAPALGTKVTAQAAALPKARPRAQSAAPNSAETAAVDAPAPEIFETTQAAVWDGKPSFGKVWIEVPDALQPERVEIRSAASGAVFTGAMLPVAKLQPSAPSALGALNRAAPIRLSADAASALGLAAGEVAQITVTALRRQTPPSEETGSGDPIGAMAALQAPSLRTSEAQMRMPRFAGDLDSLPQISDPAPPIMPLPIEGGFVQVAETADSDTSFAIQRELAASNVAADIQEDFVDGATVFRVFARRAVDDEDLAGALDNIRFVAGGPGVQQRAKIVDLPKVRADAASTPKAAPTPEAAPWMEVGIYHSRNEAKAVMQRLARRAVPAHLCETMDGASLEPALSASAQYRVFGGPVVTPPQGAALDQASFCAGVAVSLMTPTNTPKNIEPLSLTTSPTDIAPPPTQFKPMFGKDAVRLRIGEATGDLSIKVPNPFSEPIKINVGNAVVTLPVTAPATQVAEIARALAVVSEDVAAQIAGEMAGEQNLPEPLAATP